MEYPERIEGLENTINRFARYKTEMGSVGVKEIIGEIKQFLLERTAELEMLPEDPHRAGEPSELEAIRAAAPSEKVEFCRILSDEDYIRKLRGAINGRFAGCALGAPVELLTIEELEAFATAIDAPFPPQNYWPDAPMPFRPRYKVGKARDFTVPHMRALPPDDDIIYTFLALLTLEQFGPQFTTENIAELWQKYLPVECTFTAERITLNNLRSGIPADKAGAVRNSDTELIGAAIRCDGWAFVNPLNPERASEYAHRDAYLSHRKSGIYSAMYFAAVIASAFGTDSVEEALEIGLQYVPTDCEFSRQVRWALAIAPEITDYKKANQAVSKRFPGMDPVHTINNACLTVWGIIIGKNDFSKGISETVAMAYDNDCTAATVGSVLGAFLGIDRIPDFWYVPWNNTAISYLNGIDRFDIEDTVYRFYAIKRSLDSDGVDPEKQLWPTT